MSWNPHMEVQYINSSYPYNSAGSFMEYFEGLTYQHVNFIFDGASHVQLERMCLWVSLKSLNESVYPSMTSSFYKFGLSDSGNISYYDHGHNYEVNNHELCVDEYRRASENSSSMSNEQTAAMNMEWEGNVNTMSRENPVDCPRRQHNGLDYQVVWQDSVDPDNMTYEELLELGETVGTQSRGLSQELISLLPVSKYKCSLFSRKKSRNERYNVLFTFVMNLSGFKICPRCVICQMEYKRGERRITLPCKHVYHAGCGSRWLSINKACPICYTEVFGDASKP
ncbi:zinc finger protein [Theobroma cacao]|nr:zinc finger protein [Theobroma cacao]